jgi:hypothetical protein
LQLPTDRTDFQELLRRFDQLVIDEEELNHLGTILFDSLFRGQIGEVFANCLSLLKPRQLLRIKLSMGVIESEVATLPWECMFDPMRGPLALLNMSIVRYVPLPSPIPSMRTTPPIRVLLTSAAPSGSPPINVERELAMIQAGLSGLENNVQIVVEPHLTKRVLQQRLEDRFDIWHFVGHGGLIRDGRVSVLYFEDAMGDLEFINAQELRIALHGSSLRLVTLSAERTAQQPKNPHGNMAVSLLYGEIPTVIGMRSRIVDNSSRAFFAEFYRALALGFPIDACVVAGRRGTVHEVGLGRPDWGIPVVYTRAGDDRLFDPPSILLNQTIHLQPSLPPLEQNTLEKPDATKRAKIDKTSNEERANDPAIINLSEEITDRRNQLELYLEMLKNLRITSKILGKENDPEINSELRRITNNITNVGKNLRDLENRHASSTILFADLFNRLQNLIQQSGKTPWWRRLYIASIVSIAAILLNLISSWIQQGVLNNEFGVLSIIAILLFAITSIIAQVDDSPSWMKKVAIGCALFALTLASAAFATRPHEGSVSTADPTPPPTTSPIAPATTAPLISIATADINSTLAPTTNSHTLTPSTPTIPSSTPPATAALLPPTEAPQANSTPMPSTVTDLSSTPTTPSILPNTPAVTIDSTSASPTSTIAPPTPTTTTSPISTLPADRTPTPATSTPLSSAHAATLVSTTTTDTIPTPSSTATNRTSPPPTPTMPSSKLVATPTLTPTNQANPANATPFPSTTADPSSTPTAPAAPSKTTAATATPTPTTRARPTNSTPSPSTPITPSTTQANPTPRISDAKYRVVRVCKSGLALRSAPSADSRVIKFLPLNALVTAVEEAPDESSKAWKQVRDQTGAEGWVIANFLQRVQ